MEAFYSADIKAFISHHRDRSLIIPYYNTETRKTAILNYEIPPIPLLDKSKVGGIK